MNNIPPIMGNLKLKIRYDIRRLCLRNRGDNPVASKLLVGESSAQRFGQMPACSRRHFIPPRLQRPGNLLHIRHI
jgi:hypothetical protein